MLLNMMVSLGVQSKGRRDWERNTKDTGFGSRGEDEMNGRPWQVEHELQARRGRVKDAYDHVPAIHYPALRLEFVLVMILDIQVQLSPLPNCFKSACISGNRTSRYLEMQPTVDRLSTCRFGRCLTVLSWMGSSSFSRRNMSLSSWWRE